MSNLYNTLRRGINYSLLLLGILTFFGGRPALGQAPRLALYQQNFNDTLQQNGYVGNLDAYGELSTPITGNNRWWINGKYEGTGGNIATPAQSNVNGGIISGAPKSPYLHIATNADRNANWDPTDGSSRFCVLTEKKYMFVGFFQPRT